MTESWQWAESEVRVVVEGAGRKESLGKGIPVCIGRVVARGLRDVCDRDVGVVAEVEIGTLREADVYGCVGCLSSHPLRFAADCLY